MKMALSLGMQLCPMGMSTRTTLSFGLKQTGCVTSGRPGGDESVAEAVNNHNEVVGFSDGRPFFWSQSTGMTDLTPKGFNSGFALDINDAGEVVGNLSGVGARRQRLQMDSQGWNGVTR